MKNKIEDLRNHLFAELEDLRDPDKKFDPARTQAVVSVSQTIINSAKAENEFLSLVSGSPSKSGIAAGSGFIPMEPRSPGPLIEHQGASGNAQKRG